MKTKTKVLIVSHTYVVAVNQQKIEALAANKDLEITLLTPTFWKAPLRDTALEKTADPNYLIKSFPAVSSGNNDRFWFSPFRIIRLLRDFRPDVIHVEEEPWSLILLEFSLLGKLFGAKVIFFTWENLFRHHKPWYSLIEKINFKLVSWAFAGNSEAKKILQKRGFTKNIDVLPQLGVDPQTFKKQPQYALGKKLGLKSYVFGSFARLESQKGIPVILKAFDRFKDRNVSLLLIGSGPMLHDISELAARDDRIVAPGVIHHSDMPAYFSLLDAFILASETTPAWKEQFGHVLIEAMAAGVPLIGSSSGAIPEVIGEAGLVFQEGDPKDLYQKMTKIFADKKLYQELVAKGQKRVQEKYTQEKIADKTWSVYLKLTSP